MPDFASPAHNEATVTFQAVAPDEGNTPITNARDLRRPLRGPVSPVADTDPATNAAGTGANNLDAVAVFVPGTYEFVANARGYGHLRFRLTLAAGQDVDGDVLVRRPTGPRRPRGRRRAVTASASPT